MPKRKYDREHKKDYDIAYAKENITMIRFALNKQNATDMIVMEKINSLEEPRAQYFKRLVLDDIEREKAKNV